MYVFYGGYLNDMSCAARYCEQQHLNLPAATLEDKYLPAFRFRDIYEKAPTKWQSYVYTGLSGRAKVYWR